MPEIEVSRLERRSHADPDELRTPPKTRSEIVRLAGITTARLTFAPGWRWSDCVKPIAKTQSCQVAHAGYAVSGTLEVELTDGTRRTICGGESYTIPPGHDAWVVGDKAFESVEVMNAEQFAKAEPPPRAMAMPGRNRLTLAFNNDDIEREYERDAAPGQQRNLRTGLILSLAIWLVAGIVALTWNLPNARAVAAIALLGMVPIAGSMLWAIRGGAQMRRQQILAAISNVVAGFAGLSMTVLTGTFDRYALPVLLTTMLAVFSFLGLRFIYAVAATSTYTLFYTVFAAMRGGEGALLGIDYLLVYSALFGSATAAYYLEHAMREAFHERRSSERLLLNILPASIAARLKADEVTLAEGFEHATVAFADLVGFTMLSAQMPPEKLVAMLNDLFSAFDDLAARHKLEKIKTIGDAYMVAGGVPVLQKDHAAAVVQMALEMLDVVARYSKERGVQLDVRIGVHTGPVVAGVIGKRKFAYDLWGDTVNTASRMESHGMPGRAQLSAATWELVQAHFDAEDRGEIEIKGKGRMRTFLLNGRKAG
jgi:class 3 adenylate cyclase